MIKERPRRPVALCIFMMWQEQLAGGGLSNILADATKRHVS
jgi:hypothetical protein